MNALAFTESQKAKLFNMFLGIFSLNGKFFLSLDWLQPNNNKKRYRTKSQSLPVNNIVVRPKNVQLLFFKKLSLQQNPLQIQAFTFYPLHSTQITLIW